MGDSVSFPAGDDPVRSPFAERLATYRSLRDQIERNILALATSVDGMVFEFQASLHDLALRRGGYVMLEGDGAARLGQVTDLGAESQTAATEGLEGAGSGILVRLARGRGIVLESDGQPFHAASVRPAHHEEVRSFLERTMPRRAGLTIGELLLAPGVPVTLDSGGLNRHTFMCGQSGSGKTYSLGVLLERVLAETDLRVVILDPNSDYVGLGQRSGTARALSWRSVTPVSPTRCRSGGTTRTPRIRCGCGSPTWIPRRKRRSSVSSLCGTGRSTRCSPNYFASRKPVNRWSAAWSSCWRRRHRPSAPPDELSRLSAEGAVQIAAEGRKYGLYLLTSTQRPHKVHENVVSQCDNLLLMRMNSKADLAELGGLLSFVPEGLLAGASSFRMGNALVAGKWCAQAAYVQMGERVTEEGGADLPVTWATPRPS